MAHASLHKLAELHEERQADPDHPAPHTVVVIRDPELVPPSSLRTAATTPREAFPPELYPELADRIDAPALFDDIDLVLASSGSSGEPRLVGLSIDALMASVKATHSVLGGPGALDLGAEFPPHRGRSGAHARCRDRNFPSDRRLFPWFQSKGFASRDYGGNLRSLSAGLSVTSSHPIG